MAKIVGYDASAVKRCTCSGCSAVIEYVQNEVQSHKSYDYTGDFDMVYWVPCPGCGNQVTVKRY